MGMIEVRNLTKYYGNFPAIEDISFEVDGGEVLGLLGPNGSGKTTTMRILTGYMPPTAGEVKVAGYDIVTQSRHARRHIGYMPENVPLYTDMTVQAYLKLMGTLRDMDRKRLRLRIDDVVDLCGLEEYYTTNIGRLSKGFRQRVGIAQSILHEPDVLIMDEPTIGIDPRQVVDTRRIIRNLGGEHTIIISSHILPEVSMVANRVLIIHEGRVVAMDKVENLSMALGGGNTRLSIEVRGPAARIEQVLREIPEVMEAIPTEAPENRVQFIVICRVGRDIREEISRKIIEHGWGLSEVRTLGLELEDIFLRLTTKEEGVAV